MEYKKRAVILDTNFFMVPHQFKIDVLSEIDRMLDHYADFVTSQAVIGELKNISKSRGKAGVAAKVGLLIIEKNKNRITIVKNTLPADEWIEQYAQETKAIVCTNDINLKIKLKKLGIKIIGLRSKTKIGFVQ